MEYGRVLRMAAGVPAKPAAGIRRRALVAGAAALSGGGLLAACSRAGVAARPTTAQPGIHLVIQLNWQGVGGTYGTNPVHALADEFLQTNWASKHPGVTFTTILGGGSHMGNEGNSATISSIIAGQGPDLIAVCCDGIPALEDTELLLPLDAFVQKDNIDLGIFPAGVLSGLTTARGLVGLPNAGQTEPLYVNLTLLNRLGLSYPEPGWDYQAAARLWAACAGERGGKHVYGACLNFAATMMQWLVAGFGGSVYDQARTTCLLDSPACVQAFDWLVPQLWEGVVVPRQSLNPVAAIQSGQAVFATACCGSLGAAVAAWLNSFEWDLVPMPAFAVRPANGIFHALYGINSTSRAPQSLLWDLLRFICIDKQWQMYWNARLALAAPNQITPALWEEWITVVRSTVPFTQNKHLEYYAQAAQYGQGWAFAKYSAAQAAAAEQSAYTALRNRALGVPSALRDAAQQITALEKGATGSQAKAAIAKRAFPSVGAPIAVVRAGL